MSRERELVLLIAVFGLACAAFGAGLVLAIAVIR